jgi:hypothetical protein
MNLTTAMHDQLVRNNAASMLETRNKRAAPDHKPVAKLTNVHGAQVLISEFDQWSQGYFALIADNDNVEIGWYSREELVDIGPLVLTHGFVATNTMQEYLSEFRNSVNA